MTRPNLLLFMPDQLRADAVGAFGSPVAQTPVIDALAARGTVFRQAFVQHPVCSPSRASIFTGWYPHVAGHRSLTNLLKPWEPNLLKLLRDDGYHVAWAGRRGDTYAEGVTEMSTDRYGFLVPPQFLWRPSPYPPGHPLADAYYHGRRADAAPAEDFDEATVRTAERWLADGLPEPWVLLVALVFPHPPFEVEEPWYSMHDRAAMPAPIPPPASYDDKPRYLQLLREAYGTDRLSQQDWAEIAATYHGMVSRVDMHLGRVLDAVDAAGAADRTVTAFFTDHGEYLGDHGLVEKWPSGLHDCLVREPLVIATPDGKPGVSDALVEMVDLLPTLLDLAGVDAQHTHFGRSLVPLLEDPMATHRDAAFSEGGFLVEEEPLFETSPPPYETKSRIQHTDPASVGRAVSVRTSEWTFVHRLYETDELYDRAADPGETVNLVGRPEVADVERRLRDRVLDWLLETADVVPWQADARF